MSRQEFGSSGSSSRNGSRHPVSEKYYDCLQCAEQCRHTNPSSIALGNSSKKNYNNNNNSHCHSSLNKNRSKKSVSASRKSKNKAKSGRRTGGESVSTTKSLVIYRNSKSLSTEKCLRIDEFSKRKKNGVSSMKNSGNQSMKIVSTGSGHLTPVRKRSSLARPVRVHDSFVQPRMLIGDFPQPIDVRCIQQQPNSQDSRTTGCDEGLEEYINNDNVWPMKLRLEEMLELSLSRGTRNRRMRTRKRNKMVLASMFGHFKDTEKLLKVLNNVDQDNRYNVKRCSVM